MELFHAAPVSDMLMIAIIRNPLERESPPQYPIRQLNTPLQRPRTRMLRLGYSRWKPTQAPPLSGKWLWVLILQMRLV